MSRVQKLLIHEQLHIAVIYSSQLNYLDNLEWVKVPSISLHFVELRNICCKLKFYSRHA